MWSYSPQKLEFLRPHGVEVRAADDVMPRGLFERIVARSEITIFQRHFPLRRALRAWRAVDGYRRGPAAPVPVPRRSFLQSAMAGRASRTSILSAATLCTPSPTAAICALFMRCRLIASSHRAGDEFGDVGPKLLSDYIASDAGAELRDRLFSPMFFNSIDWTEIDRFNQPIAELAEYLNDERVFGIHLWTARNHATARDDDAVADLAAVRSARALAELHDPRRPLQYRQEPPHRQPPLLCQDL